ncbi:MAG: DedA family protein [Solirubrobacteraceae bacterium]
MTALIQSFGILGVLLLMVPESACIPIPSEVTLLFSGFAVSRHLMSFPLAVLAATAGNLIGSLLAYGVGASGLIEHLPGARVVLHRWEHLFDRHGMRAVLIARLLPLARTFVSLPAGARRVPLFPFIALTTLGCAIWASLFILIGLLSGSAWSAVGSALGKVLLIVGVLIVGLTVCRRRRPGRT